MDEAKAAAQKDGKKKTSRASIRKAGQKTIDMASVLASLAAPGARLTVDMPVAGKGQVRLVLSEPTRRISVWGSDMDEAMRRLLEKASG